MAFTLHYYRPGQKPITEMHFSWYELVECLNEDDPEPWPNADLAMERASIFETPEECVEIPSEIVLWDGEVVGGIDAPIGPEVEAILIERGMIRSPFSVASE